MQLMGWWGISPKSRFLSQNLLHLHTVQVHNYNPSALCHNNYNAVQYYMVAMVVM